jgi:hypothetical protein
MQLIKRFFTWFSDTFRKQGIIGKVVLAGVTLFVLCCLCSVPIAIMSPSTPTPETGTVNTAVAEINQASTPNVPTNAPKPTNTPQPTPKPQYKIIATQGLVTMVVIDSMYNADRQALLDMSKEICDGKDVR